MDGERPGGGARRRILRDAVHGSEHPSLPARAGAGEAVDARVGETRERAEVGIERRNLVLASERDVHVCRPEVIELDGQGGLDTEEREQVFRRRERLPPRDRLGHPPERDTRALALEHDRHDTGSGLEPDLAELQRGGEHECRSEDGMSREGELHRRREDADACVRALTGG